MIENIALIASGISALTALTTSLRALGRKRENSRDGTGQLRRTLRFYLMVTVIWVFLSIVFVTPVLYTKWMHEQHAGFFLMVSPFFVFIVFLVVFWKRVLNFK
jgi:hypothetical protein